MSYELEGSVKLVQEAQTFGSGFTKRELVVTVESGEYPQEINVEFVQDNIGLLDDVREGDAVKVTFDIRGREYNGRYFNNLLGWKLENQSVRSEDNLVPAASAPPAEDEDDIPF